MRIERLENSKHKQERVLVYLEDGSILRITGAELLQFGLYQGLDLTPETLAAAFAASAAIPGEDTHGLEQRLETLLALIRDRKLPFSLSDAEAEINAWRAAGYPACHHSDAYRAAYRPAYRVLHKRYVRLLPLLAAIDHYFEN